MKKPKAGWGKRLSFWAGLGLVFTLLPGCSSPPREPPVFADISAAALPTDSSTGGVWSDATKGKTFTIGDLVKISLQGISPDLPTLEERIKQDGTITLPLIGALAVTNRTADDLVREIYHRYVPKYYPSPAVPPHSHDVFYYVGGEVKIPGRQPWMGEITVTQAIEAAGGFAKGARKTRVQLIRANGTKLVVDCKKAVKRPELDLKVLPGDKIYVPRSWWW